MQRVEGMRAAVPPGGSNWWHGETSGSVGGTQSPTFVSGRSGSPTYPQNPQSGHALMQAGQLQRDHTMQVLPSQSDVGFDNRGQEENPQHPSQPAGPGVPGTGDFMLHQAQGELGVSMGRAAYPFQDPYFGSIMAAYGANAMIHPAMLGVQQARVALPSDLYEEGPVYVNARQYHGILRRRQSRAKAESENRFCKGRRPYLHESRHQHALRRARGDGGRFLNTKLKAGEDEVVKPQRGSSEITKRRSSSKTNRTPQTSSDPQTSYSGLGSMVSNRQEGLLPSPGVGNLQQMGQFVGVMNHMGGGASGSGLYQGETFQSSGFHPIMDGGANVFGKT